MGTTNISIVARMARNGVIGNHRCIPWKMSNEETRRVRALTQGATIVVGRKTFQAMATSDEHLLADRRTVILTHDLTFKPWGRLVAHTWKEIVDYARTSSHPVFVIGGEALFRLALKDAEEMHLTRMDAEAEGDAHFPEWRPEEWHLTEPPLKENVSETAFVTETWHRRNA